MHSGLSFIQPSNKNNGHTKTCCGIDYALKTTKTNQERIGVNS